MSRLNGHCDWCQRRILAEEPTIIVDELILHSGNSQRVQEQSCEKAYRLYCKHIKESAN